MNADYIIKFVAYVEKALLSNYNKEYFAWEKLLKKEILVKITSELAEKSDKFDDTNYIHVEIVPTVFEKFIITETGSNYEVQTVDVPRLLYCWEALGFPFYIDTTAFNFYKDWAIGSDMGTGIPKNL
jgi:hypothetical protein